MLLAFIQITPYDLLSKVRYFDTPTFVIGQKVGYLDSKLWLIVGGKGHPHMALFVPCHSLLQASPQTQFD